jgi:predicted acyltransferase
MNETNEIPASPEAPKKNNTMIIIAVVVVLLLCCCCLAGIPIGKYLWDNGDAMFGTGFNLIANFA